MTKTAITLPGKIVTVNSQKHLYLYYENSDSAKLSFKYEYRDDKDTNYSVMTWLSTRDAFVGNEHIAASIKIDRRCNIVSFDLSGKMTDRIYEAEKGEIAKASYPSRDDKYLIFTSERLLDPEIYPLEGLAPMVALGIIDLKQKEVVVKIDSFGRLPNLKIGEWPWLQGGYRFVYSMDGATQFIVEGEDQPINPLETKGGVYVFDVATGTSNLLIPGGFSAIASPVNNHIAYEKDHCVIVRDLSSNKERTIYKYKSNETILNKHWTPDGKFIFISYLSRSPLGELFKTTDEKLIDASSGEEVPFKNIGFMQYGSYTWK